MEDVSGLVKYSQVIFLTNSDRSLLLESLSTINASNGPINLGLNSSKAQNVEVALFDLYGQLVYKNKTNLSSGLNRLDLLPNVVSSGMYILVIRSEDGEELIHKVMME